MKLDNMRVAIKPMTSAQAIDLGFTMARHWFMPLWKLWLAMATPFFLIVLAGIYFLGDDHGGWFSKTTVCLILVFLWLKPIYEKAMIDWLGLALFEGRHDIKPYIKNHWRYVLKHVWVLLFRYRLSISRQYVLPVLLLERPNKKRMQTRLNWLKKNQSSSLAWFTTVLSNLEMVIAFGIFIYLLFLYPTNMNKYEAILHYFKTAPILHEMGWAVLCFISVSIVAPFFVCASFALYLTKRCLLEGWDIELMFRSLSDRYQSIQDNPIQQLKNKQNSLTNITNTKMPQHSVVETQGSDL